MAMRDAIYYTFSSIAQAQAALVALLGVFVVIKLEQINRKMWGLSQNCLNLSRDYLGKTHNLVTNHNRWQIAGNVGETIKAMKKEGDALLVKKLDAEKLILTGNDLATNIIDDYENFEGDRAEFPVILGEKKSLHWHTIIYVGISVCIILASLIILPNTPIISYCLAKSLFYIILILTGLNLLYLIFLIIRALKV